MLVFSCTFKAELGEVARERDEMRSARDEANNNCKEVERKLKNMEAEALQTQEVFR